MNIMFKALVVAAAVFCSLSAHASVILQNQTSSVYQVNFHEPMGQSFQAEDANVKFAFFYRVANPGSSVSNLRLRLLNGNGLNGMQLANHTFSLLQGYEGFYDVDFSTVQLTVGNLYTAVLDIPGNSPYWGVDVQATGNVYGNGRAYFMNASSSTDMRFRVTPVVLPAEVPEPATIAMLSLGLAGLAAARRKKA